MTVIHKTEAVVSNLPNNIFRALSDRDEHVYEEGDKVMIAYLGGKLHRFITEFSSVFM